MLVAWPLIIFFKASTYMYIPNNSNLLRSDNVYAYQCVDYVTMYKYAFFDQNIPCCLRVMSISLKDIDTQR